MKISKIAGITLATSLLSTSLLADFYIGVKAGSLSTDKTVYGSVDGDQGANTKYLAYDDVSLLGLEYGFLQKKEIFVWGGDISALFNKGDFLKGGMLDTNLKMGAHYNDFSAYGLVGVGIQSLSSYTVATNYFYGIGAQYDIFKHLAVKVEYRMHNMGTTKNDEPTAGQSYSLSGATASLLFKF